MASQTRYTLIFIAVGQFLAAGVNAWTGLGTSLGDRAVRAGVPPELPLGLFFSIWGVIFLLYAFFAVHMLRARDQRSLRLVGPLAAAGIGNILWMVEAQLLAWMPLDYALLFVIAVPAWIALRRFDEERRMGGGPMKQAEDALTGLLAGWITAAIAVSTPPMIRYLTGLSATDRPWLMLFAALSVAAFGAWLAASRFTKGLWFYIALLWGVSGIAANNFVRTEMGFLGWAAAIAAVMIAVLRLSRGARGASAWG
ncbi:MAG: hypothetical protein AAFX03_10250 [Pseudomonadota bacterium]